MPPTYKYSKIHAYFYLYAKAIKIYAYIFLYAKTARSIPIMLATFNLNTMPKDKFKTPMSSCKGSVNPNV